MSPAPGRRVIVSLIAALSASLLLPSPASASNINCVPNGNVLDIQFFEFSPSQRIRVFINSSDQVVITDDSLDSRICGAVSTYDAIDVSGIAGRQIFTIDHGGPGVMFPRDWGWNIDLAGGKDVFKMLGTSGRDRFYANREVSGAGMIDDTASYRRDDPRHLRLTGVTRIVFEGGGGRDILGATTGTTGYRPAAAGVLKPSRIRLFLDGGSGNDRLFGGEKGDDLEGGPGDDTMNGRRRLDACDGGPGTDSARNCERVNRVP